MALDGNRRPIPFATLFDVQGVVVQANSEGSVEREQLAQAIDGRGKSPWVWATGHIPCSVTDFDPASYQGIELQADPGLEIRIDDSLGQEWRIHRTIKRDSENKLSPTEVQILRAMEDSVGSTTPDGTTLLSGWPFRFGIQVSLINAAGTAFHGGVPSCRDGLAYRRFLRLGEEQLLPTTVVELISNDGQPIARRPFQAWARSRTRGITDRFGQAEIQIRRASTSMEYCSLLVELPGDWQYFSNAGILDDQARVIVPPTDHSYRVRGAPPGVLLELACFADTNPRDANSPHPWPDPQVAGVWHDVDPANPSGVLSGGTIGGSSCLVLRDRRTKYVLDIQAALPGSETILDAGALSSLVLENQSQSDRNWRYRLARVESSQAGFAPKSGPVVIEGKSSGREAQVFLPPGTYRVEAAWDGAAWDRPSEVYVPPGQLTYHIFEIPEPRHATVSVTASNGTAIPRARIWFLSSELDAVPLLETEVDSSGVFSGPIPTEAQFVSARLEPRRPHRLREVVPPRTQAVALAQAGPTIVVLEVGWLRVNAIPTVKFSPLAGLSLHLASTQSERRVRVSAPGGSSVLIPASPGPYQLSVDSNTDLNPFSSLPIEIRAGETTIVDFQESLASEIGTVVIQSSFSADQAPEGAHSVLRTKNGEVLRILDLTPPRFGPKRLTSGFCFPAGLELEFDVIAGSEGTQELLGELSFQVVPGECVEIACEVGETSLNRGPTIRR